MTALCKFLQAPTVIPMQVESSCSITLMVVISSSKSDLRKRHGRKAQWQISGVDALLLEERLAFQPLPISFISLLRTISLEHSQRILVHIQEV